MHPGYELLELVRAVGHSNLGLNGRVLAISQSVFTGIGSSNWVVRNRVFSKNHRFSAISSLQARHDDAAATADHRRRLPAAGQPFCALSSDLPWQGWYPPTCNRWSFCGNLNV